MSVTKFTPEPHVFKRIEYRPCWLGYVTQILGSFNRNTVRTISPIHTFKVRSKFASSGKKITRFLINISGNKITSFSFQQVLILESIEDGSEIIFESSQISDTTQSWKVYRRFEGWDIFHMVHRPQRPARSLDTIPTELPWFLGGG